LGNSSGTSATTPGRSRIPLSSDLRQRLNAATAELSQRIGRSPTVTELAAHLEVADEEILEALEAGNTYSTPQIDAPAQGDED
jgi:RNA polymerase sigma-B factor